MFASRAVALRASRRAATAPVRLTRARVPGGQRRSFVQGGEGGGGTPRPATDPIAGRKSSPSTVAMITAASLLAVGIYAYRPKLPQNIGDRPGNVPIQERNSVGGGQEGPTEKVSSGGHPGAPKERRPPVEEMAGGEKDKTTPGQSQGRKGEEKSVSREKNSS